MWGFDRIWGIFLLQHSELLVTWYDFFSTRVVEKVATYNLLYSHKYTPLEISRMNRYPKMSLALFTHVCLSLGDLFMKLKNTWNHQSSLLLLNAKIGWCQSVKWRKKHRKTDISERPLRSQSSKHCIVAHYLQWRKTKVQLNYKKSDPPQSPVTIKFNLP